MYSLCVRVFLFVRFIHAVFWRCLKIFLAVTAFGDGGDVGISGWGPGMPINILALTRQLFHHHTHRIFGRKRQQCSWWEKPVVGQAENFEFYSDSDWSWGNPELLCAFLCFWKYFIHRITIFVVNFFPPLTVYTGEFSISNCVDVPHFLKTIFIEL